MFCLFFGKGFLLRMFFRKTNLLARNIFSQLFSYDSLNKKKRKKKRKYNLFILTLRLIYSIYIHQNTPAGTEATAKNLKTSNHSYQTMIDGLS